MFIIIKHLVEKLTQNVRESINIFIQTLTKPKTCNRLTNHQEYVHKINNQLLYCVSIIIIVFPQQMPIILKLKSQNIKWFPYFHDNI